MTKFLNHCATIIQKHVKGHLQRQRDHVIIPKIRRFRELTIAYFRGIKKNIFLAYRLRKIMKSQQIRKTIDDIYKIDNGGRLIDVYI
jgi:hypothetical protein